MAPARQLNALGRHLALAGFMGSGKTTVGETVARRLGRPFVDLDREVEARAGAAVADLFATRGEPGFRALEEEVARDVLRGREPVVVALGGGAVLSERTRRDLAAGAFTVLLDVDPEVAWKRVVGTGRPLAREQEDFHALHRDRQPLYEDVADAHASDADGVVLAAAGVHVGTGAIDELDALVPGDGPVELVTDAHVAGIHGIRAQVALGMHAIHFQISGRAFRQPGLRYTREEEHDLATFGHITERTEQRLLTGRSAALEPWELVARSGSSLALRRKPDLTARIAHGQLAAVRTSSIDAPSLVLVQRIRIEADGEMSVGVRVIRGEVRGAAVRAAGSAAQKYERALIVEADPQRGTPASLITASGLLVPGARMELHTSRTETVRIGEPVERGFDFDRMAYEPG